MRCLPARSVGRRTPDGLCQAHIRHRRDQGPEVSSGAGLPALHVLSSVGMRRRILQDEPKGTWRRTESGTSTHVRRNIKARRNVTASAGKWRHVSAHGGTCRCMEADGYKWTDLPLIRGSMSGGAAMGWKGEERVECGPTGEGGREPTATGSIVKCRRNIRQVGTSPSWWEVGRK